ncbi:MAG TPA: cysteine peptidase family C39 domain-containing protein, partial [Pirellulales bacterium]|nr:cysteine peptidase family C39 domain-containing protein [Pirellulales bacterium]
AFEKRGIPCRAALLPLEDVHRLQAPAILHLNPIDGDIGHFIVVLASGSERESLYVIDGLNGPRIASIREYQHKYGGRALVFDSGASANSRITLTDAGVLLAASLLPALAAYYSGRRLLATATTFPFTFFTPRR